MELNFVFNETWQRGRVARALVVRALAVRVLVVKAPSVVVRALVVRALVQLLGHACKQPNGCLPSASWDF